MSRLSCILPLTILLICLSVKSASAQEHRTPTTRTPEEYLKEGEIHALAKKYDKAVLAYRQALNINPQFAAAHHGLGSVLVNMGRLADALEPLQMAVRLDPQNAIAHLNLGLTLAGLRRAEEAMVELNEAKRLSPQDPRVFNEIGNALHNNFGRIEEALESYKQARQLNPKVPSVHHNIGLMLMRLGRFADATGPPVLRRRDSCYFPEPKKRDI